MTEPSNDDAARALERMASGDAPTPQPRPRTVPAKPQAQGTAARPGSAKIARPSAPVAASPPARQRAAPAIQNVQEALADARPKPAGLRTAVRGRAGGVQTGLGLKRTLIPILLTTGLILIALAVVHFAWQSDDNPVIEMPAWIIALMFGSGVLAWLLAAVNMLAVRRILAAEAQKAR